MFGNDSAPTRVFAYGAKRPHEGLDAYWAEERAMHRLKNAIVAIERDRREAARQALLAHRPDIAEVEARLAEIDAEIEALRAEIRRRNSAERKRRPADDPATARIAELREERRSLVGRHDPAADACACWRCRRRAAYADPEVRAALEAVEAEADRRRKALYADREVSWCDYNAVVAALGNMRSGPPPRFVPWTGRKGRIVVQIQGGATWQELLAGCRQVKVTELAQHPAGRPGCRRSRRPYYEIRLRIGRDARGDDRSAWVATRFVLHRPLPADGRVQQVWLVRRRAGLTDDWSVQFVVARAIGWTRPDTATARGAVGVDLRWRQRSDGSLIVAHAEGDDGWRETLVVPRVWLDRLRYVEHLQSVRDREFDGARAVLLHWLSGNDAPEWLREATAGLAQWRSPGRLAAVVLRWRENRFDGDADIYARMEAWRAQDRHLADWAGAQRRKYELWRQDHYRRFAARLRWRYETVALEDVDWKELLARPPAEEEDEPERINRRWFARAAAPGMLRQCIQDSIEDARLVPAANTSRMCSVCEAGPAHDWDAAAESMYRCAAGHQLPAWQNAAVNLLRAVSSGSVVEAR